jgi:hypothetical protein
MIKNMSRKTAVKILEKPNYPTAGTIKAFAVVYPLLFRAVLRDNQVKKIVSGG